MKIAYISWIIWQLIINTLSQVFHQQSPLKVLMTKNLQEAGMFSILPKDDNIRVEQAEESEQNQWEQYEAKQTKNSKENQGMNEQINYNNIQINKNQNDVQQMNNQINRLIKLQDKKRSVWNAECGNREKELSQQCDDGNRIPGDGCDHLCRLQNQKVTIRPEIIIIIILIAFLLVGMTVFLLLKYRKINKNRNSKVINQKFNASKQKQII